MKHNMSGANKFFKNKRKVTLISKKEIFYMQNASGFTMVLGLGAEGSPWAHPGLISKGSARWGRCRVHRQVLAYMHHRQQNSEWHGGKAHAVEADQEGTWEIASALWLLLCSTQVSEGFEPGQMLYLRFTKPGAWSGGHKKSQARGTEHTEHPGESSSIWMCFKGKVKQKQSKNKQTKHQEGL